MERWEKQELKKRIVQKELEHLQKRRKVENYANLDLVNHLQRKSKFVIFAIIFDLLHYNIYPLFDEGLQLYVYDSTQSIAFLFYIYAIYKLIPKELVLMHFILGAWLWFSIGDVFNVVYVSNGLDGLRLENWLLLFNVSVFSYKFRDELYLRWEILRFNLNMERYEGVF